MDSSSAAEATGRETSTDHDRLRATLRARYGLSGEYVGAPTVALILGLGRTTVHDQIREGRFVIPHRLVARKPLFLLDDLVAWMLGVPSPVAPSALGPESSPPAAVQGLPVFRHAAAEAAFLRACERRGIDPLKPGR